MAGRPAWSLPALVAVAVGGAAGSSLRVAVGDLLPVREADFPWTTLAINVVGCALLALLPALHAVRDHPLLAPLLGTGLLGGFTTLSAWSQETHALVTGGRPVLAATYAVSTLVAGLGVVAVVRRWTTPGERDTFEAQEGDL